MQHGAPNARAERVALVCAVGRAVREPEQPTERKPDDGRRLQRSREVQGAGVCVGGFAMLSGQ